MIYKSFDTTDLKARVIRSTIALCFNQRRWRKEIEEPALTLTETSSHDQNWL
jgi:hypothetical protein